MAAPTEKYGIKKIFNRTERQQANAVVITSFLVFP